MYDDKSPTALQYWIVFPIASPSLCIIHINHFFLKIYSIIPSLCFLDGKQVELKAVGDEIAGIQQRMQADAASAARQIANQSMAN